MWYLGFILLIVINIIISKIFMGKNSRGDILWQLIGFAIIIFEIGYMSFSNFAYDNCKGFFNSIEYFPYQLVLYIIAISCILMFIINGLKKEYEWENILYKRRKLVTIGLILFAMLFMRLSTLYRSEGLVGNDGWRPSRQNFKKIEKEIIIRVKKDINKDITIKDMYNYTRGEGGERNNYFSY